MLDARDAAAHLDLLAAGANPELIHGIGYSFRCLRGIWQGLFFGRPRTDRIDRQRRARGKDSYRNHSEFGPHGMVPFIADPAP
ncbi:MAG: hypothetical protein ACI4XG_12040 [Bradyrhizobium sp.]